MLLFYNVIEIVNKIYLCTLEHILMFLFYGFSYYKGTGSYTNVFLEFLEFGAQEG